MKYIFLTEEKSMSEFLKTFLEKYGLAGFRVIPHEGKSHLKKSITAKFRALNGLGVTFVVLIDQDSSDCLVLKSEIDAICRQVKGVDYKIRIACHELEAWFLGDTAALDLAFGTKLSRHAKNKIFRDPDRLGNAKQQLHKYIKTTGQINVARKMAQAMTQDSIASNKSRSFHKFLTTIIHK